MVHIAQRIVTWCATFLLVLSSQLYAQSTPTEFAEMSLQELFELETDDDTQESPNPNKWSFAFQYKYAEFEGYLQGDSDLSFDEVLFVPDTEVRTNSNFPVVPTVIIQQAKLMQLGFQHNQQWRFSLVVPWIRQETDHISIVPGYDEFLIATEGVGDTQISASYRLKSSAEHQWWFTFGVSLPTGSIDEVGDTPRGEGDQQVPYTMQLGSGTYDIPLAFDYQSNGKHDFSLSMSAMIRTGSNDRNYRLGNNYSISGRYRFNVSDSIKPFLSAEISYTQSIRGQDDELLVPLPAPYPASITNPKLYGGRKLSARAGLIWQPAPDWRIAADASKPLYQYLNGPQPKENWRAGMQVTKSF